MGELEPCPFCGSEPVRDFEPNSYRIACGTAECPAASGWLYFTEAEAVAAWNRRAGGSSQQDDERERADDLIFELEGAAKDMARRVMSGQDVDAAVVRLKKARAAMRAVLLRSFLQPSQPARCQGEQNDAGQCELYAGHPGAHFTRSAACWEGAPATAWDNHENDDPPGPEAIFKHAQPSQMDVDALAREIQDAVLRHGVYYDERVRKILRRHLFSGDVDTKEGA